MTSALRSCLLAAAVLCAPLSAQSYRLHDVSPGPTAGNVDSGMAVNEANEVLIVASGLTRDFQRTYLWSQGAHTHLIPPAAPGRVVYGYDLRDDGTAVGFSRESIYGPLRAFEWSPATGWADLDHAAGLNSRATATNNSGLVVGSFRDGAEELPCAWHGGAFRDLRRFAVAEATFPTALTDGGKAAGFAVYPQQNGTNAFSFDPAHGYVQLPHLSGNQSQAFDLNEDRQVVGYSRNAAGAVTPVLWDRGQLVELPLVPSLPAHLQAMAYGINESRQIVGYTGENTNADWRAVLWQAGVAKDLNDLIPTGSGWTLRWAADINESGWITGTGDSAAGSRSFLLEPLLRLDLPDALRAGQTNTVTVRYVQPTTAAWLYAARATGATPPATCPQISLDLFNPVFFASGIANGNGEVSLQVILPARWSGRTLYLQALEPGTCEASNLARVVIG